MAANFRNADGKNETPVSAASPLPVTFADGTATAVGAVAAAGTGYAPSDTITLTGGEYGVPTTLTVTHTKVVSAVVKAGGTGGTPGAVTITGTTGTGTKFQATGTISAGGVLTDALVVSVAGDYTVNPTDIATEPVTGGSLSGCTVTVVFGVLTTSLTTAGNYSITPTNPVAQASTSGSGVGATFTMAYRQAGVSAGSYAHITTNTTTTVKSGAGILQSIVINKAGASANIATIYDNTAGSGTVIGVLDTVNNAAIPKAYNLAFSTGLTIVTATGTAGDLTVVYR